MELVAPYWVVKRDDEYLTDYTIVDGKLDFAYGAKADRIPFLYRSLAMALALITKGRALKVTPRG